MEIKTNSFAGTLESSDVFVEVSPNSNGRKINIESVVLAQFGENISAVVNDMLDQLNVNNVAISLKDRGALECTIRARVETALKRQEGK